MNSEQIYIQTSQQDIQDFYIIKNNNVINKYGIRLCCTLITTIIIYILLKYSHLINIK